jgi:hypothetical protein
VGRRLRAAPPPWKVAGPVSTAATVPTLVITGAWSPLYEEVADALTAAGAARLTLDGHEHRPGATRHPLTYCGLTGRLTTRGERLIRPEDRMRTSNSLPTVPPTPQSPTLVGSSHRETQGRGCPDFQCSFCQQAWRRPSFSSRRWPRPVGDLLAKRTAGCLPGPVTCNLVAWQVHESGYASIASACATRA